MLAVVVTRGSERRLAAFLLVAFLFFQSGQHRLQRAISSAAGASSGHSRHRTVPQLPLFRGSRRADALADDRAGSQRSIYRDPPSKSCARSDCGDHPLRRRHGVLVGEFTRSSTALRDRPRHAQRHGGASGGTGRSQNAPPAHDRSRIVHGAGGRQSPPGNNPFVAESAKRGLWLSPRPDSFPQFFATVFHALLGHARYPVHSLLNLGRVEYVAFDPHWQSRYAEFIRSDGRPWLAGLERPERISRMIGRQPKLTPDHDLSEGRVAVMRVTGTPGPKFGIAETVIAGSPSLRHMATGWQFFEADRRVTHLHDLSRNPDSAENSVTEIWIDDDIADLAFSYVGSRYSVEPADQIGPNSSRADIDWVATYRKRRLVSQPAIPDATASIVTDANLSGYKYRCVHRALTTSSGYGISRARSAATWESLSPDGISPRSNTLDPAARLSMDSRPALGGRPRRTTS